MKHTPLVSIVIPVFNEEQYIKQCIESVLAQTYKNWECTIVNNCSSDASLKIAIHYKEKDNRINVYSNQTMLNIKDNHNEALKKISPDSKYCKMVLGDDFLFPDCLEKMVEVAESDSNVGIVSSYRLIESVVANIGLPYGKNVYTGEEICRMQLLDEEIYLFGSQTSMMFRSDIVRNRDPFFVGSSSFWDAETCYQILKYCNFGFVYSVLSFTRRKNESFYKSLLKYNPALIARYIWFKKYAKIYLSEIEYTMKDRDITRKYYLYLGKKVFTNRDKQFWTFHNNELKNSGLKLEKIFLMKYAIFYLLNMILNPKIMLDTIRNKYKSVNL